MKTDIWDKKITIEEMKQSFFEFELKEFVVHVTGNVDDIVTVYAINEEDAKQEAFVAASMKLELNAQSIEEKQ